MILARPADARPTARGRLVVALAAVVLVVAGCSSSGSRKLTSADLSKTMPTSRDLGSGYHRDKAGENEKDGNTKLQVPERCKALLNGDDDKGKQRAKREFKDDKEREIDVSATVTEKDLASVEKAVSGCTKVPFTSGATKGVITFKLGSSVDIGDDADAVDLVLTVTQPISLIIKGHGIVAKRGDVGITVLGLDGVDDQATVTPIDNATVDKAARDLDQKIKHAQG